MRRLADLVLVLGLVAFALATWPMGFTPAGEALPAGPAWAGFRDHLLDGPDAGRWAEQAMALRAGDAARLDPHRMPTWTLLTTLLGLTGLPVALAGHLVNHGMRVALGPILYLCGRRLSLAPAAAAGAALLVLASPPLSLASRRFGIDTTVSFAWPVALLAAWAGAAHPLGGLAAGLVAALAAAAHFTTIPAPLALLVAVFMAAPPGRRLGPSLGFLLGTVAGLAVIFQIFPAISPWMLLGSFAEGIAPAQVGADPSQGAPAWGRAAEVLRAGLVTAPGEAGTWLGQHSRPWPPALLLGLVALGLFGPALRARPDRVEGLYALLPRRGRISLERLSRGLDTGLPLGLMLLPVPLLFVAQAPSRYVNNLVPLVVLLLARGLAVVGALGDTLLAGPLRLRRWPRGLLQSVVVLAFVAPPIGAWWAELGPTPPPREEVIAREAGLAVRGRFGEGVGVATLLHEVAAQAGGWACPFPGSCPEAADAGAFEACLDLLARECPGEGDIPWVVGVRAQDDRPPARVAMDAWIAERHPLVGEWACEALSLRAYALPRR